MTTIDLAPAFNNDPHLRQAALQRLAENRASDKAQRSVTDPDDFARTYYLARSYCHLLSKLDSRPSPPTQPFFADVILGALDNGAPTSLLACNWLRWVYLESSAGLRSGLAGTKAEAVAEQVLALHARQKQPVLREEWRAVRQTLSSLHDTNAASADLLDIIAAMAWDLEASPGAVSDVLVAWESKIRHDVNTKIGWTQQMQEELISIHTAQIEQACINLGIQQSDLNKTDMKVFAAEVERLGDECGDKDLFERAEERSKRQQHDILVWWEQIRQHFLAFHTQQMASSVTKREGFANTPASAGEI